MDNFNSFECTLLDVIECHDLFLSKMSRESDMSDVIYKLIRSQKSNKQKNYELFKWLKTGNDVERCRERLQFILEILREVDEGQEHVANLIDGTNGELFSVFSKLDTWSLIISVVDNFADISELWTA